MKNVRPSTAATDKSAGSRQIGGSKLMSARPSAVSARNNSPKAPDQKRVPLAKKSNNATTKGVDA